MKHSSTVPKIFEKNCIDIDHQIYIKKISETFNKSPTTRKISGPTIFPILENLFFKANKIVIMSH